MRKIVSFILCVTMLFSLVACGQNKEKAAYNRLRDIIIEKGTFSEANNNKFYKYEYSDYGETYFMFNDVDLSSDVYSDFNGLFYLKSFDNGSVMLRFNNDGNFSASAFIHNSDLGIDSFGDCNFRYKASPISEYNIRTELETEEYNKDLSEDQYKAIRKDVNTIVYSAMESFIDAIEYLGISKTDFGFTSFDK